MPQQPTRVTAPYNFVPLSSQVCTAGDLRIEGLPSQDDRQAEALSGTLEIELRAHGPILVSGGTAAEGATEEERKVRTFARTPGTNGKPVIPGSSLRGMIRNVMEIACFGRMALVDDQRVGVRDLAATARLDYGDRVSEKRNGGFAPKSRAGWLRIRHGKHWLTPCEFARIDHDELSRAGLSPGFAQRLVAQGNLIANAEVVEACFFEGLTSVAEHHLHVQRTEQCHTHHSQPLVYRKCAITAPVAAGLNNAPVALRKGQLVFTGVPRRNNHQKHMEFFFFDRAAEIEVPAEVWRKFIDVHENQEKESPTWEWRRPMLKDGREIPVFWLPDAKGGIAQIGLAMMFKLAADNSVHRMIRNTSDTHRDGNALDLPTRLFGQIGGTDAEGKPIPERDAQGNRLTGGTPFRTRLSFGWAEAVADTYDETHRPDRVVHLQRPKPGFAPAYVRQRDFGVADGTGLVGWDETRQGKNGDYTVHQSAQYRSYMNWPETKPAKEEIRGWKRYPSRTPIDDPGTTILDGEASTLRPLRKVGDGPIRFTARIRYHNLLQVELGALVWALTWGGDPGLRHALGMGRAFGWGQVEIVLVNPDPALDKARDIFADKMKDWATRQRIPGLWKNSVQMRQLRAMADPLAGDAHREDLAQMQLAINGPNHFKDAKEAGKVLPEYGRATPADMIPNMRFEYVKLSQDVGVSTTLQTILPWAGPLLMA